MKIVVKLLNILHIIILYTLLETYTLLHIGIIICTPTSYIINITFEYNKKIKIILNYVIDIIDYELCYHTTLTYFPLSECQ